MYVLCERIYPTVDQRFPNTGYVYKGANGPGKSVTVMSKCLRFFVSSLFYELEPCHNQELLALLNYKQIVIGTKHSCKSPHAQQSISRWRFPHRIC